MTQIINKTPHPVNIVDESGKVIRTFPKAEVPIRLKAEVVRVGELDGIPLTKTVFGDPEGLPEPRVGVFYIVSQLVKAALPEREDLLVPSEVVRDGQGNIVGCRSLGR